MVDISHSCQRSKQGGELIAGNKPIYFQPENRFPNLRQQRAAVGSL